MTKLWLKTKQVLRGWCCFHRVYLSRGFVFWFCFFYFVSVIFNCQHCSVHKKFCKEEKTCSVVSTLNMSLANKRFSVWKMLRWELMFPGRVACKNRENSKSHLTFFYMCWKCLKFKDTLKSFRPLVALRSNVFTSGPLFCFHLPIGFMLFRWSILCGSSVPKRQWRRRLPASAQHMTVNNAGFKILKLKGRKHVCYTLRIHRMCFGEKHWT